MLDAGNRPVAAAPVRLGDRFSTSFRQTRTDAAGEFRIANADPGGSSLTVQADGYSPEMKEVFVDAGLAPLEFRLKAGHTIRGRVVDQDGKPVAGAFVTVSRWRAGQTLDWQTLTDAAGRFRWDGAPGDGMLVSAGKREYGTTGDVPISPSDQETVITLARGTPLRIRGTVVDADTGKPIPSFRVVPAVMGGSPIWLLDQATPFRDGRYQIAPSLGNLLHLIRIEAKGYLPAVSPEFRKGLGRARVRRPARQGSLARGHGPRIDRRSGQPGPRSSW